MARIMVIHHAAAIGGGSISFVDVLDMLKDNHDVIGCCPSKSKQLNDYLNNRGHLVENLDIPIPIFNHYSGSEKILSRGFWQGIRNLKYKNKIEEFIRQYEPDVVIVNSSVMAFLGPVIKKCNAKAICYVRETFVEGFSLKTKIMKHMLNKGFDGVIFLSKYDEKYASLDKPITAVIPDCVNPDMISEVSKEKACNNMKIDKNTFNILYVGGLNWIKGIDVVLESLLYMDDNITLTLVGDYNFENSKSLNLKYILRMIANRKGIVYSNYVETLLNNEKIKSRVNMVGLQIDMSNCYASSDIVIFPSKVPHQARPVFEAAMYKKTVVISDFKQTNEYVIDELNGKTFLVNNPKSLAGEVNNLYRNREKNMILGKENYKMMMENHNINIEKNKMNFFIETVLKKVTK